MVHDIFDTIREIFQLFAWLGGCFRLSKPHIRRANNLQYEMLRHHHLKTKLRPVPEYEKSILAFLLDFEELMR